MGARAFRVVLLVPPRQEVQPASCFARTPPLTAPKMWTVGFLEKGTGQCRLNFSLPPEGLGAGSQFSSAPRSSSSFCSPGFTLIELLVTISIIAVLAGFLL